MIEHKNGNVELTPAEAKNIVATLDTIFERQQILGVQAVTIAEVLSRVVDVVVAFGDQELIESVRSVVNEYCLEEL